MKGIDRFRHRDHLGSLRVVVDDAGWKIEGTDYYPFGMEIVPSGEQSATASRRKYTGHERDEETGLDYMLARYKATFSACFMSPDPVDDVALGVPESWNKYAYVRNAPLVYVDPSGLKMTQEECKKAGGTWDENTGECDSGGGHTENLIVHATSDPILLDWWLRDLLENARRLARIDRDDGGGGTGDRADPKSSGATQPSRPACTFQACTLACFAEVLGLHSTAAIVGPALGGATVSKRGAGYPRALGSGRNTSALRIVSRKLLGGSRFSQPRWAPSLRNLSHRTLSKATFFGRWASHAAVGLGYAAAIWDGALAGRCTSQCLQKPACGPTGSLPRFSTGGSVFDAGD